MNKEQAIDNFWNSFDVPAFDENTVPDAEEFAEMGLTPYPRITYELHTDSFGSQTLLRASLWDRSPSWATITALKDKIATRLSRGGQMLSFDDGAIWIVRSTPFAQRMGDTDDSIRRILINIEIEFISEV